jgi:predicted  nucleic acid-binding Zn-ribbon protein
MAERRQGLREQLELLWELQKIDLGLKSIKEEKDRYPKEIKKLDEKQKAERERIEREKEKVESLEKARRQKEGQLALEQEKIKRAEGRMSEVKTNKEYQAFLSEIDAAKGANSRMEEEILQIMDEIDELKKDLSKREKDAGVTLEKIEAERKKLQEKMTHDEKVWGKQMERREVLSKQIEAKLVKLYNTLNEKRQGVGVVGVKHETCQGCYVNVPPQLFIEVQKNNTIVRCPHCNRILFWEGDQNRK